MSFFIKKQSQKEQEPPQLFFSQEIYHKNIIHREKSKIKHNEIQVSKNNITKDVKRELNENSNNNLALNDNKDNLDNYIISKSNVLKDEYTNKINNKELNSLNMNNNDYLLKENENEKIDSNIISQKINNPELDNEWNESKINFDNISMVSKINSYENNNEQSNIIDNNILLKCENLDFNIGINDEKNKNGIMESNNNKNRINDKNSKSSFISNSSNNSYNKEEYEIKENDNFDINSIKREKKFLEEKLKKEQNINKEKSYYIEILKKALNDNFLNINCTKGNKNTLNIGIILEYSKTKLENENLKKNIIMQKILCDDMKNEIQMIKKERDKITEKLNSYEQKNMEMNNKIEDYEIKLKEKNNSEKQLKSEVKNQKEICINLNKKIFELMEINSKLNKEKSTINIEEHKNEHYEKLIKEKNIEINELKMRGVDMNQNYIKNNTNDEQNENINNDVINNSCKNIEEITKRIKIYFDKVRKNNIKIDEILMKTLKEYIDNINPDINGNISLNGKMKLINEFMNFVKIKLEILFNHYEIFQMNNFNFDRIKIEEEKNEKDIYSSSNSQKNNDNNINEINTKRIVDYNNVRLNNNKMFKKINLNEYKSHIISNNDFVNNNIHKLINDKEESKKSDNNDYLSNLKDNIMDKKRIITQSNLSEIRKSPLDITSNNSRIKNNNKINDLFSNIFKEKMKKKKNIINLKSKELINTNSQLNSKDNTNSFLRATKMTGINISNDLSKMDTNIFPSNKKVLRINEKNDIIPLPKNTSRKSYKTDKENKPLNRTNLKENNIHSYDIKTTFPLILTNTKNNTYLNQNIDTYTLENNKVMESSLQKRNVKTNKNKLSLGILRRELFTENKHRNRNIEINDLAEEIMKPSFLKGNNTLSINKKNGKEMLKITTFKTKK